MISDQMTCKNCYWLNGYFLREENRYWCDEGCRETAPDASCPEWTSAPKAAGRDGGKIEG